MDNFTRLWKALTEAVCRATVPTMTSPALAARCAATDLQPPAACEPPATALRYTPSTRVLWRSRSKLQLELGQRRIVVDGLSERAADVLNTRRSILPRTCFEDDDQPEDSDRPGHGDPDLDELLGFLHRLGFLSRIESSAGTVDSQWQTQPMAATADLEALGDRFGERNTEVMSRRQGRAVSVQGVGRLPALIAALLAAAGIGHVSVRGEGEVTLRDAMPGGLSLTDEGRRTASAAADAVVRAAPDTDTRAIATATADLVVLAGAVPVGAGAHRMLLVDGTPHLSATVWAASAVIGPLVLPGVSSCLGCADLHRQDRDPAWPALAVQLAAVRRVPSDVAVCAFAAALTVMQALSYLDGEEPAVLDGTLEMALPDWRVRRRSWFAHERCTCQQ